MAAMMKGAANCGGRVEQGGRGDCNGGGKRGDANEAAVAIVAAATANGGNGGGGD